MAREEEIILDFNVDVEDSVESIESLTKASKELREERKKLNLDSAEGQKRIKEINAALDSNNQKIKENVSALEKQKINVGNYRSALDGVHPALGKVAGGLEKGTEGFKAMTLQALRFIATPIGAILAAIVAVFALLKTALSQNDALMDKFENITNAVGVVLEVVVARVGKLGEALIKLATGDFVGAINSAAEAFGGLGDEIEKAVKQQQLFLDASRDLEDSERRLRIETARQSNEITKLIAASKNRNATLEESEALLNQAAKKEEDLQNTKEDIARRDLLITVRRLRAAKEFQQQAGETFDAYVERLLSSEKLGSAELNKITDKVVALEEARNSGLVLQQKIENQLSAIQEKRAEAIRKQNEQLAKRQKDSEDYYAKKTEDAQKAADIEIQIERDKADAVEMFLGNLSRAVRGDAIAYKAVSSAQALIDTYAAANAAFKSGSKINIAFGVISAAAAVAAGLMNVARINNVQFAEGGWTGPGGKWDAVGIVHADEYVVPKRVRNDPMAQTHLSALERMRLKPYADGGFATSSATSAINAQFDLVNVIKNMPAPVVSVKEITTKTNRVRVKESISKR